MGSLNRTVGALGEAIATDFLKDSGYTILTTNFRTALGEIDIIASRTSVLHFIEVKTRVGIAKGYPYEAVNKKKREHMHRVMQVYLLQNSDAGSKLSLDVVSIILNSDHSIDSIKHYQALEK